MAEQILHLPISSLDVRVRSLGGTEDLLLSEANVLDTQLALAVLREIVSTTNGSPVSPEALSITDIDTLLLLIRRSLFGDLIRSDANCPSHQCGARIEVSFQIGDYLAHYQPRSRRGVEPADEPGWFCLKDLPVTFRLPTGADQVAIAHNSQPEKALLQRCVRPPDLPAKQCRRVEKAMEAMAPNLAQLLQGQCSECGAMVELLFDPQRFVLQELQNQAHFVYDDIHLLALYYQWSEAEILALPRSRRLYYAERIRHLQRSA